MSAEPAETPASRVFALGSPPHAAWLKEHANELLAFCAASADREGGGFGGLSVTGARTTGPKQLYATARMTYGFALGAALGREGCAELAEHGLLALRTIFRDDRDGGWFAELSADGQDVSGARKETYGHAFVLLAASAAAEAGFQASDLVQEAAAIFDTWLYDASARMCVDSWDRSWQRCDSYRGINANMHAVEAFLSAYAATGRPDFLHRADAIGERLISYAAGAHWRVPEHFTDRWAPLPDYNRDRPEDRFRPFGATPGHGLEWARLLLALRLAGGADQAGLLAAAEELFRRAVADGWDPRRCGFAYTVDWQGREVTSLRLHWPLAEAICAARYLHAATGRQVYADWYATFWQLADRCFIDHRSGSWWHELGPDGTPGSRMWAGKPDLYHALNATLASLVPPGHSLARQLASSPS